MEPLEVSSTVLNKGFDRLNPFQSRILERYRLNGHGSTKETWHVVLDLSGSGMSYKPGDSIGIYPENNTRIVHAVLEANGWDPACLITDSRSKQEMTLVDWLSKKANLSKPTSNLIKEVENRGVGCIPDAEEVTAAELLTLYPRLFDTPQEISPLFSPLLPRFYSISSSQRYVGDEAHCTIAQVRYEVKEKKREGVCSHFLCSMLEEKQAKVGLYIQPTKDFTLPEDNTTPIIMVGPGTGIAPFRAFMQERLHRGNHTTKNWLFFGERERKHDFFYEAYWQHLVDQGVLTVSVAFSRDQNEKVYVQHKMWQERKKLWQWLQEGAYFYVCGDASRMAKDVEAMLLEIFMHEGGLSVEDAKAFLTKLRKEKRYLRDVY